MNSFFQLLKLIRYQNLAIIAFTQFMVALFLIDSTLLLEVFTSTSLYLVVISTIFIAAAGYLINDYYDIKIDYVNKPSRVVIGKHIKRQQVIIFHTTFNFIGILLGATVSWWIMGVNLIAAFLLWLYSNQLKRLPLWGNITVSLLTSLSVFIIYILYRTNLNIILIYAAFAFFMTLIREIIKDMEDVEGDEKFGCKTLPISIGMPASKKIIYFINALFLGAVFIITKDWHIFLPFLLSLLIILSFLSFQISKADKKLDYKSISQLVKIIMLVGISSMIFLK